MASDRPEEPVEQIAAEFLDPFDGLAVDTLRTPVRVGDLVRTRSEQRRRSPIVGEPSHPIRRRPGQVIGLAEPGRQGTERVDAGRGAVESDRELASVPALHRHDEVGCIQ